MPPLSLSDEELSLLRSLAEPVAYGRRGEFLMANGRAGAVELAMGGSELWANANQSRRAPFRWLLISDR